MKITKRIICFMLAMLCLAFSLTSCANKMSFTGNGLTHKKTGISYTYVLDPCYQPIEYDPEAYTKWKRNDVKIEYYAIKGLEPTEWLYCPMMGEILCATDEVLPDVRGFDPSGAYICIEAATAYTIHEITNQAKIDAIVERYLDENTPSYSTVMDTSNYSVKFISEKYPEFYYSLVLVADADGVYVHDRLTGRYIDMGLLFEEYDLYDGYEDEDYDSDEEEE
ncbi:MAG: hypothetical protein IJD70_09395 [Clostridia bacterium]|nr:hypothetical protein [Clostridia bacterium]